MRSTFTVLALLLLAGCGAADRLTAPSDYTCANDPMYPGAAFRIIYSPAAAQIDTTLRTLNRYLLPHHSADSVVTVGTQGLPFVFIFANNTIGPTYCVTVFDSLQHHLPNATGALVVP